MNKSIYIYICSYTHICIQVCIHIHTLCSHCARLIATAARVCMYTNKYTDTYMHIYTYIHISIYMYMCVISIHLYL